MTSEFVISLDFEFLWGLRDHADRDSYGANILGGRDAIPRILDLFTKHEVSATWATVGFLFCENRDELIDILPAPELRPAYTNPALSNYTYLDEVGADETADPYYFAASLIRQIAQTPGQEMATHTLSHYYCLEDGASNAAFEADLSAAIAVAARRGITLRSIVFPRNQYALAHLEICRRHGIEAYRGNPSAWAYRPTKGAGQTLPRRALRLVDAHSGFLGHQTYTPQEGPFRNVPASQFLRPRAGRLASLHPAHIRTLKAGMTSAARSGRGYHLWWHPHNFGANTAENIDALAQILAHFAHLRDEYGMVSRTMAEETAHT